MINHFTPSLDYFDLASPSLAPLVSGTVLFDHFRLENTSNCNNSRVEGRHGFNVGGRAHHAVRGPKTRNQRIAKESEGVYGKALH